jgi:hypothetical protein
VISVVAWGFAALLIIFTVSIHYETMLMVSDRIIPWAQHRFHGRRVMAISIAALMLGHIVEIWLFAMAFVIMLHMPGFGAIAGGFDGSFDSVLYFSTVNYTSLADSHMHPEGPLRNIAASETLDGMMMIAWSASFTYLKMEQIWKEHRKKSD